MVIAIGFMYLCAFLLLPFIGYALWLAFSGDRMYVEQDAVQQTTPIASVEVAPAVLNAPAPTKVGDAIPARSA